MLARNPGGRGGQPQGPAQLSSHSSKSRYLAYLRRRKEDALAKNAPKPGLESAAPGRPALGDEDPNSPRRTRRHRSFWTLLVGFWDMIEGQRLTMFLCLCTVTIYACVTLAAPASFKIVIDYILADNPKPLPRWAPTANPRELLWGVRGPLWVLTLVGVSATIWGRYQMTRMTQILRAAVRRRVFDHTVRLPLHRVYELKSGGAASILREDAGQAADLLFSMMYNPWRAVIQLVGTLVILAIVDWKMLLGAVALLPAVYFTQRAWIGRIRPMFREVRNTRTMIDAHATESFGGMRVVRGFVRQRAEAARFIRNNHLMARQEMLAWWWSRAIEIIWQVLIPAGSMAVIIYAGNRVLDHKMTVGDVMMFSGYLVGLLNPLEALSASATSIQAELASFDRVLDILEEPEEFETRDRPATAALDGEHDPARPLRRAHPLRERLV